MSLPPLKRAALLAFAIVALAAPSAAGDGALVEVNDLILRADGGFQPQTLPRRGFAPIDFQGHVDIDAKGGGTPSDLRSALIDFDRDGRLEVAGLPTCSPEAVAQASTAEARAACRSAIVGSGHLAAHLSVPGLEVEVGSPLTIFNGPRLATGPSVVLHAQFTVPAPTTYAILAPIEPRSGPYRYRVRLDLPPLLDGDAALTHIDVKIGRRYRAGGRSRSYVSARCSDNVLRTHGYFSFADGTVISGLVEKYCHDE